jgi:integrase
VVFLNSPVKVTLNNKETFPMKNPENNIFYVPAEVPETERFSPDVPFGEYARHYVTDSESRLSPKTYARYLSLLERIEDGIGHIVLGKLESYHLKEFYKKLGADGVNNRNGKTLSDTTIHHYHELIRAVLSTAVRDGIIEQNCADSAHMTQPKKSIAQTDCLSEAEIKELLKSLAGEPIKWQTAVKILLFTGMRRGELLGLEWRDIDFDNRVIRISRTSQYVSGKGIITKEPKTAASVRVTFMPEVLYKALKTYRKSAEAGYARLFVSRGGIPLHPDSVNGFLMNLSRKSGLDIKAHKLRHTFCSLAIAAGVPANQVSALAGHSQVSTTLDTYTHILRTAEIKATKTLNGVFSFCRD